MSQSFEQVSESISDGPPITFRFDGDVCTAELAGATLRAELESGDRARLRVSTGSATTSWFVLADVTLHPREGLTSTENVMAIGSALLWSHWRWVEAQPKT